VGAHVVVEGMPTGCAETLGVVETRGGRPVRVEYYGGGDDRSGERAAAGLVHSRDQERTVVAAQLGLDLADDEALGDQRQRELARGARPG